MIRILQCVNEMHRAGLETMLMNYYRFINRSKIQFDFLTHRKNNSDYDDEIEFLGGKIYHAPRLYPQNYGRYFSFMKSFFHEHSEYNIVHSHIDVMSYLPLLAALKNGIPIRIAHSHNTDVDKDYKYLLKQYFRRKVNSVANYRLACGEKAGRFLFFNKPFLVVPNAIDPVPFYYNPVTRKTRRDELRLGDALVIGHVGRFSYQKNHEFLINVFEQVHHKKSNSFLLLIGTGENLEKVQHLVYQKGLQRNVIFLGNRKDVNEWYQAMDIFVLPSFFEGIPVVGIEAQFSSLPCFFSTGVPKEVDFSKSSFFLSLKDSPSKWADCILTAQTKREKKVECFEKTPYDIRNTVASLEQLYLSLSRHIQ